MWACRFFQFQTRKALFEKYIPQWSNFPSATVLAGSSKHKKVRPTIQTKAAKGPAAHVSHFRSNKSTSPGRHRSIIKSSTVWRFGTRTFVSTSSSRKCRSFIAHFHHTNTGTEDMTRPAPIFWKTLTRFGVKKLFIREAMVLPVHMPSINQQILEQTVAFHFFFLQWESAIWSNSDEHQCDDDDDASVDVAIFQVSPFWPQ